jgi:DNA mismatch endonuclease (patch repair protein)
MHKTKEQITYNMQQVKSKDTKIEVMLRKELWSRGLRYQNGPMSILWAQKVEHFLSA